MISLVGVIFAAMFMFFFAWLFLKIYRFGVNGIGENILADKKSKFVFAVFMFAGAWLCYWLLSQNRFIYYSDLGKFWIHSFKQMRLLFSVPVLAVMKLGGTIWFADYNAILPTLIALPMKLFGYTFIRYVLIMYALFLVPSFFVLTSAMKFSTKERNYMLLLIFMCITFNPFYHGMLIGMIGVCSLLPVSLSLLLLKDYDALTFDKEQIKRDIYISSVLLCTFMFRRYFVFYVQGYIAPLILLSIYQVFSNSDGRPKLKLLKNAVLNMIVIGLFALAVMIVFFAPMVIRILGTRYTEEYVTYNASWTQKFLGVINMYGYFAFILACVGIIMSLLRKQMRRYACFCGISVIVTSVTFFQIQAMATHHFYILSAQMFILSYIGVIQIAESFKKDSVRKFAVSLLVMLLSANFAYCFFPASREFLSPAAKFFSRTYNPLIRDDIPELHKLAEYLDQFTKDNDKTMYIIPSKNGKVAFGPLSHLNDPDETPTVHGLVKTYTHDLVSGFPPVFLDADFIVITNTVAGSQEVVTFIFREVQDSSSPVGRHFRKNESSFRFSNGLEVFVYEKVSNFTQSDLQYMADYFTSVYPNHKNIFADRILNRAGIGEALSHRTNSKAIYVLRWLLSNDIFTPEQIAEASDRPVQEIKMLIRDN